MLRRILLSAAVVLLLSSGVLASIGQVQCFSVGAFNKVKADGGFDFASSRKCVTFGHAKNKYDVCLGSASMNQGGVLSQHACVAGRGHPSSVRQKASAAGVQGQLVTGGRYGHGLRAQGQCLTLNLNTKASNLNTKPSHLNTRPSKKGGFGFVGGTQSFAGGQNQMQTYRGGFSASSQFVYAEQSVNIIDGGGKGSGANVTVNNNLDVVMFQGNMAR